MLGLTYIRNTYAFTMQELADKLGVVKQTISKWEKSDKQIPQGRIVQMSEEIFKGIPLDYFRKKLSRVEQLKVQLNKIRTEFGDKVLYHSIIQEFDLDNPSIIRPKAIYESDILDIELRKEVVVERIREKLDGVSPVNNVQLLRLEAFCGILDSSNMEELKTFFIDVKNLEDKTLSSRAEWWLWFLKLI